MAGVPTVDNLRYTHCSHARADVGAAPVIVPSHLQQSILLRYKNVAPVLARGSCRTNAIQRIASYVVAYLIVT